MHSNFNNNKLADIKESNKSTYISLALMSEAAIFLILWLTNEYLATLLTAVVAVISFGVLIVAVVSELIEKSKVSRSFFLTMILVGLLPIILAVFFFVLNGDLGWK